MQSNSLVYTVELNDILIDAHHVYNPQEAIEEPVFHCL